MLHKLLTILKFKNKGGEKTMSDNILPRNTEKAPVVKSVEQKVTTSVTKTLTEAKNMFISFHGTPDKKAVGQYNAEAFESEVGNKVAMNIQEEEQLNYLKQQKKAIKKQNWDERVNKTKSLSKIENVKTGVIKDDFSL